MYYLFISWWCAFKHKNVYLIMFNLPNFSFVACTFEAISNILLSNSRLIYICDFLPPRVFICLKRHFVAVYLFCLYSSTVSYLYIMIFNHYLLWVFSLFFFFHWNSFFSPKSPSIFMSSFPCDPLSLIRVACMSMGGKLFTGVQATHHWFQ